MTRISLWPASSLALVILGSTAVLAQSVPAGPGKLVSCKDLTTGRVYQGECPTSTTGGSTTPTRSTNPAGTLSSSDAAFVQRGLALPQPSPQNQQQRADQQRQQQALQEGINEANGMLMDLGTATKLDDLQRPHGDPNVVDLSHARTLTVHPAEVRGTEQANAKSFRDNPYYDADLMNFLFKQQLVKGKAEQEDQDLMNMLYKRLLTEEQSRETKPSESKENMHKLFDDPQYEDNEAMLSLAAAVNDKKLKADTEKFLFRWDQQTLRAIENHRTKELMELRESSRQMAVAYDQIKKQESAAIFAARMQTLKRMEAREEELKKQGLYHDNDSLYEKAKTDPHLAQAVTKLAIECRDEEDQAVRQIEARTQKKLLEAGHQIITLGQPWPVKREN